jgi:hypothetical protein
VVVVLSKEFISKKYPMEELQLLLHWRDAAEKNAQDAAQDTAQERGVVSAKLLPVFYDMSYEELGKQVAVYQKAAAGQMPQQELRKQIWAADVDKLGQWVEDLKKLGGVTGLRKDQVCRCV